MMRVLLLDDEKNALDELEYHLRKYSGIDIAAVYTDPLTALEEFKSKDIDAAFLDIDMPVVNGLNVAREFLEFNSDMGIVFVTAYNDYAVNAFEINAIDYILKPVSRDRLEKAVERLSKSSAKETGAKKTFADNLSWIDKCLKQDAERIAVYDDEEILLLRMSDALFFEAELGKTMIITRHKKYRIKDTLDVLEDKYRSYGFYRCHRSYLVNLRYVNKISPMFNNSFVIKQEGTHHEIPVSRNNIKELRQLLGIE